MRAKRCLNGNNNALTSEVFVMLKSKTQHLVPDRQRRVLFWGAPGPCVGEKKVKQQGV